MKRALCIAAGLAALFHASSYGRPLLQRLPAAPLKISMSLDLPDDDGTGIGTLFEIRGEKDVLLGGAGFQLANNSTQTSNPRVLTVFLRRQTRTPKLTDLGKPFRDGVAAHLINIGARLIAIPYNSLGIVPKVWNPGERQWRDLGVPLDEPLVGLLGMQAVRGVPLMLYIYGRESRYDAPIIFYGDQRLRTPKELSGLNGTDFYFLRGRLYLFVHERLGTKPQVAACRWAPGDLEISDCMLSPVPEGTFFYSMIPDPDANGLLLFDRLGMVLSLRPDRVEVLAARAVGRSEQVYSSIQFEDDLLVGQYPTGSLARWNPAESAEPYSFIAPKVGAQICSTQNLREAQSLAIFGGRVVVGIWPFGELWEGEPGEEWRLLARPFVGPACGDAPYTDEVMRAGGPEKNVLGQRIWGMSNWSTGLALSTAAKHELGAKYQNLLTPEQRAAYWHVWLLERDLELACEIPGSGRMTVDIAIGRGEISIAQQRQGGPAITLCTAPLGSPLVRLDRGELTFGKGLWGSFPGVVTGAAAPIKDED